MRSLNSAILKWPDRRTVITAARVWAAQLKASDPQVAHVWCVGSYARGDWGVGSDLDVIVILHHSSLDRLERSPKYLPPCLAVPVDLWFYTTDEWQTMSRQSPRLWQNINTGKIDLLQAP